MSWGARHKTWKCTKMGRHQVALSTFQRPIDTWNEICISKNGLLMRTEISSLRSFSAQVAQWLQAKRCVSKDREVNRRSFGTVCSPYLPRLGRRFNYSWNCLVPTSSLPLLQWGSTLAMLFLEGCTDHSTFCVACLLATGRNTWSMSKIKQ